MQTGLVEQLAALGAVLDRAGVHLRFGPAPSRVLDRISEGLPLSDDLRSFYEQCGPVATVPIPWTIEWLTIISADALLDAQRGYRWVGRDSVPDAAWRNSWIVIAQHSGDPFIADCTSPGTPVLIAPHGTGSWEPVRVAPSLTSFFAVLTAFFDVLLDEFLGQVWDDHMGTLRERFVDRLGVELSRLVPQSELTAFLACLE
jgi:hypothetical protein